MKFEGGPNLSDIFVVEKKSIKREKSKFFQNLVGTSPTKSKSHVPLVLSGGPAITDLQFYNLQTHNLK